MVYIPNMSGGVPVLGHSQRPAKRQRMKTSFSMSGTDTLKKKRIVKRSRVKSFRRKVLDVFQTKHFSGTSETTIADNVFKAMNLTSQVTQGDNDAQREGDSIHLEALKIEGHIQTSADSNAYKFRILVGYSRHEVNNTSIVADPTFPSPFLPGTAFQLVNGIINPKNFTVLYDQILDLNSQVEGDRTIQSFRDTIKLNKTFYYKASGAIYGKDKNLYVIVLGYRPDTLDGDPVGSCLLSYDLIFKD